MSYEIPDPNNLTVQKLKSILTQEGFGHRLPTQSATKDVYVRLYREHVEPVLRDRNARAARGPISRTPGPRASLPSSSISSTSRPARAVAQTDLADRRKTIHSVTQPEEEEVPLARTKRTAAAPAVQQAPTTPTTKAPASSSADASVPRRALFTQADTSKGNEPRHESVATSTSTSSSRKQTPSLLLSPEASRGATQTLPDEPITYPTLSTATAPDTPSRSNLGPDLRRIIAAQRAQKKIAGSGNGKWLIFGLLALIVAIGVGLWLNEDALMSMFEKEASFCDTTGATKEQKEKGCTPCPLYGSCVNGKLICMKGYVRRGQVCIRDQETARAIDFCKNEAHKLLARRAGEYQCGYPVPSTRMSEAELREYLKQQVRDNKILDAWSEIKFNESFYEMKRELQRSSGGPLIITGQGTDIWFETPDVHLPLACKIERTAMEYIWYIVGCVVALVAALRYLYVQRKKAELEADIVSLVNKTKELLKEKKKRGQDPVWVPAIEIRDLLFHEDPDFMERYKTIKEKTAVWKIAEQRLRADTRIKEYSQMVEQQQQIVWEYIGTVASDIAQNILSPRSHKSVQRMVDLTSS